MSQKFQPLQECLRRKGNDIPRIQHSACKNQKFHKWHCNLVEEARRRVTKRCIRMQFWGPQGSNPPPPPPRPLPANVAGFSWKPTSLPLHPQFQRLHVTKDRILLKRDYSKEMGTSPTFEFLNQPYLNFLFLQVHKFPFYLNHLGSKFSVAYKQNNLDSYVGHWPGFC